MIKSRVLNSILLSVVLLLSLDSYAQRTISQELRASSNPLVWDSVEVRVSNPDSDEFYAKLFDRYQSSDSTLTKEHYRLLYYGFAFDARYLPRQTNFMEDDALEFLHKNAEVMDSTLAVELIEKASAALQQEPFNIEMLNILCYANSITENFSALNSSLNKLNGVIEAIISSGTGIDQRTPWVVLYRDDIADMVSFMGGVVSRQLTISMQVEYYALADRIENIKGFYFDIGKIREHTPPRDNSFKGFTIDKKI